MQEIWKDIPNYEGMYQVSNLGRVKSLKRSKEVVLKLMDDTKGYLCLSLYKDGVKRTRKVHRLVAEAFLGHKPNGMKLVVDHIDHDTKNNKVSNLRVVTQRQNASHLKKNGSSKYTGVYLFKRTGKWVARIQVNKCEVHLGYFKTEYQAHLAYQKALKELV